VASAAGVAFASPPMPRVGRVATAAQDGDPISSIDQLAVVSAVIAAKIKAAAV